MTTDDFDPFKGESGLLDDVDLEFTNFRFGRDPQYKDQDGQLMVIAITDLVGGEETKTQFISIGKGWDTADAAGSAVVKEDGKKHAFNNSSYLQTILNRAMKLDEDAMRGRWEDTGFEPQQAAYWEGFCAHFVQEDYKAGFGEKAETRQHLMPTAILPWGSLTGASSNGAAKPAAATKKASKKAAAAKKAAPKPEPEETGGDELSEDMAVAIRAIADEADTYGDFVDRCFAEIDGLDEDPVAMAAVEDEMGHDGIWQTAIREMEA